MQEISHVYYYFINCKYLIKGWLCCWLSCNKLRKYIESLWLSFYIENSCSRFCIDFGIIVFVSRASISYPDRIVYECWRKWECFHCFWVFKRCRNTTCNISCNNKRILLFVKTKAITEGILVKCNVEGSSKLQRLKFKDEETRWTCP